MKELAYIVSCVGLVLPGIAAGRLLLPRARIPLQLAIAPVLSFGCAYLLGLLANAVRLPALTSTVIALIALVVGWAVVEIVRLRGGSPVRVLAHRGIDRLRACKPAEVVSIALLALALVTGFLLWHRFQSSFVVPPGWDAMHHGYFIRQIVAFDTLDTSVVLAPSASGADGTTSFYPLAYNLFIAILHVTSGLPISVLMLTSTTVVAGLALPVGIYLLARRLDSRRPFVAGFAALASTLPIYLYWVLDPGRTNAVLGLALVPAVILIMIEGEWNPRWSALPIAAVAVAGITGLHTSELPMAAAVAAIVMAVAAIQGREFRGFLRWALWSLAVAAAALLPVLLLEPGILGATSQRSEIFLNISAHAIPVLDAIARVLTPGVDLGVALTGGAAPFFFPWIWALLVAVGCILTVRGRWSRFLGASIAYVFFAVLAVGLLSGTLGPLSLFTVPWYQDVGRLWWTLTVLGAIPAGVAIAGLAALVGGGTRVTRKWFRRDRGAVANGRQRDWIPAIASGVVGVALVFGTALPPVAAAGASVSGNRGPVGADSVAAFRYLSSHVPAGQRVFDDMRVDGSLWMYDDYGVLPLFGNSPYVGAEPNSWLDRLWLRENLERIDSDGCVEFLLDYYSVGYVYYGERIMADGYHRLNLDFLQSDPHFTEVFSEGQVHVFRVNLPAEIPTCTTPTIPNSRNAF